MASVSDSRASSPTGMTGTSSATVNGAAVVAGIVGAEYVASTTRRRTSIEHVRPETRDVTSWVPSAQ